MCVRLPFLDLSPFDYTQGVAQRRSPQDEAFVSFVSFVVEK